MDRGDLTGQGAMGTNWSRGSSVWTWGRTSSLWGWWSPGTGLYYYYINNSKKQ